MVNSGRSKVRQDLYGENAWAGGRRQPRGSV